MYLNTFDEVEQMGQESVTIHAASLYSEFEKVKDGRGKKGKRYPLPLILTLLLLGKMAGETTINGIVDWIKEREDHQCRCDAYAESVVCRGRCL